LNANVTLVLSVALLVVSLLVRSGTVAVAASAGNDAAAASFASHCATCHGSNGSGDTPVGKSVKIPDLRSPAIQGQSGAQLAEIIANGKGAMPPFGSSLSKDEIDALVKHIHALAKTK
jgi:cytochrome c6